MRFVQFEPERMSTQIVSRILVKALMAMPAPDFSLCLFLIPERVVTHSNHYIMHGLSAAVDLKTIHV